MWDMNEKEEKNSIKCQKQHINQIDTCSMMLNVINFFLETIITRISAESCYKCA